MKIILKIGHTEVLLPDESGLQSLLKILGRGIRVDDCLYRDKIVIRDGDLEVQFKTVPQSAVFVREGADGKEASEIPVTPFVPAKGRRLPAPKQRPLLGY